MLEEEKIEQTSLFFTTEPSPRQILISEWSSVLQTKKDSLPFQRTVPDASCYSLLYLNWIWNPSSWHRIPTNWPKGWLSSATNWAKATSRPTPSRTSPLWPRAPNSGTSLALRLPPPGRETFPTRKDAREVSGFLNVHVKRGSNAGCLGTMLKLCTLCSFVNVSIAQWLEKPPTDRKVMGSSLIESVIRCRRMSSMGLNLEGA